MAKVTSGITVTGKYGSPVAVLVIIDQFKRLFVAADTYDRKHRPKNLVAINIHLWGNLVEYRGANKAAGLVPRHSNPTAIHNQFSPFFDTTIDIPFDSISRIRRNHRTHFDSFLIIGADLECLDARDQLLHHSICGVVPNRDYH